MAAPGDPPHPEKPSRRPTPWGVVGNASSLGIEFVVCIVVGLALGRWIDAKFNLQPWGLFMGLFLGIGAAFRSVWKALRRLRKDE